MAEERKRDILERTFRFSVRIVKLCQVLDEQPGVGRTLSRQLLRSGTSIGANAEEAQAGQSRADFVSKYSIACKEARETHYWLRLIAECNILPETRLGEITMECDELVAILTTIIKNTKCIATVRTPQFSGWATVRIPQR
jgi:four helix bundle protein